MKVYTDQSQPIEIPDLMEQYNAHAGMTVTSNNVLSILIYSIHCLVCENEDLERRIEKLEGQMFGGQGESKYP